MIRIARAQVLPIGVDFAHDLVRLMQLEVVNGRLAVVAASQHALSEEARGQSDLRMSAAMDTLRRAIRANGFVGRRIVTALPREIVQVKNLRLPHMPVAELASAVDFEARNVFPFDTDAAHVRFLHAGEVRQGADSRQEVIALAAKHADVDSYVEQLHRAGVVVESLDFEPCALYRSVERFVRRREDENEVHVLVDLGGRRSQVVVGRGREISFYKPVDIGADDLHEAVAHKLGVSPDEARQLRRRLLDGLDTTPAEQATRDPVRQAVFDATRSMLEDLSREVSLCLRYHSVTFRGQRPAKLCLAGDEAVDAQLHRILGSNLPIPVEALQPLRNVDTNRMKPSDRRGNLAAWTVAFGLSLKGTREYFANPVGRPREQGMLSPLSQPAAKAERLEGALPTANRATSEAPVAAARELVEVGRA